MKTCFLFTRQFDEETCLSLCLDQQGQVQAPLALRPIEEFRALQTSARTIIVLSAELSGLHNVQLPWLGESKARAALPYALEEQLAQSVTTLHFAFDRQYYQDNNYLIAVIDKPYLLELIHQLNNLAITFELITLDWFALRPHEACATDTNLLVHDQTFKGALSAELAELYLNVRPTTTELFVFPGSSHSLPAPATGTVIDSACEIWIAQRLLQMKPMNLCQGDLVQGSGKQTSKYWYQASAILFGIWIVSLLVNDGINLHKLSTKNTDVDQKIAVIYREFFPNAQQVISPKFRINQLLQSGVTRNEDALWQLLDKFTHSFNPEKFTIQQVRFQNQMLSVTLTSKDFAALEDLQLHLQQDKVKVTQSSASSHEQQVVATLELSL